MTIWSVPSTINDGKSGAPAGNPQYSTILSGYAKRPPWNVAGVDYATGVPSNVTLQDPWPGFPATTVNSTNFSSTFITQCGGAGNITANASGLLSINGNNLTISGWDFSLHGGINLEFATTGIVSNLTITQCYWKSSTNLANPPIRLWGDFTGQYVNGATISYCTIDCNEKPRQ